MLHVSTIRYFYVEFCLMLYRYLINVTQFAKTRHNDANLEIQIFASVCYIYLKLCSVAITMLYCKYFLS